MRLIVCALLLAACGVPSSLEIGQETSALNPTRLCPDSVPPALAPPAGQELEAAYAARGFQIYTCNATPTGGFAWTFKAPQANLLDRRGRVVGTHFVGPTWQFRDGSSVVGAKVAGDTVDPTAIPWLLLRAVSTTDGTEGEGEGRFFDITYVQRLSTTGGLAPSSGCDATTVGAEADVPYTANYFFYHASEDDEDDGRRCP